MNAYLVLLKLDSSLFEHILQQKKKEKKKKG